MSQLGRQPQLMEWVEDVLSVADLGRHDDALLRSIRGHILYNVSNEWPEGADDFLDAVHTLMELDVASYTAIIGCNYGASHLVDCGRFEEATEITDQAIRWARELGRPIELSLALSAAQYVARFRQDIGRAIELGLEGLELMRGTDDRMGLANALGELVNTLVTAGRTDEAQLLADEAEQMLIETDGPTVRAVIVRAVGRSKMGLGRYREAIRSLMELIRLEEQTGATFREPGWVALAIEAVDPAVAATVLGAAQRMQTESGDPDVMPPAAVGGDFERRLQEAHPRNVERGARLGWAAIQPEVAQWAANIVD
jgi:tetratricopeptide (TPR) repeat protein